jgi:hypothetical protein
VTLRIAALLLAGAVLAARAQVAAPDDWRKETFAFPLVFAPTIPYEGTEYVRFAPYWAEDNAERGFTYVILWDIKRRTFEPAELERGLNVYFDGLMEQVTRARKIEDTGAVSSATLHPLTAPEGWAEALGGRVHTWNAFVKGEPLVLNLEIAHRPCSTDRTQVFFALSRAGRDQPVWKGLRAIRSATTCATVTSG